MDISQKEQTIEFVIPTILSIHNNRHASLANRIRTEKLEIALRQCDHLDPSSIYNHLRAKKTSFIKLPVNNIVQASMKTH